MPDSDGMHIEAVRRAPSGNCRQSCGTGGLAPSRYRCRVTQECTLKRYGARRPVTVGRVSDPVGSRPAAINCRSGREE